MVADTIATRTFWETGKALRCADNADNQLSGFGNICRLSELSAKEFIALICMSQASSSRLSC